MRASLPLLEHSRADRVLAFQCGCPISVKRFLRDVAQLTARLPRTSHVLNLCEDRYHFLLGFAAALQTGQVSLLPPSRVSETLRQLCTDYPQTCCLADHDDVPVHVPLIRVDHSSPDPAATLPPPLIPAEQIAAIVFTSGSTGKPAPHAKSWGSLVRVAQIVGRHVGFKPGGSVLGTIPPQHLYGMETTIMLPLLWEGATHHGRPLLPADIRVALESLPAPRWLMTTPLQLRACIAEKLRFDGLAGVLSATMPLSALLAAEVEDLWQTPVHDVYGCTEAGIVALRRPAQNETWRVLDGLRVWKRGKDAWVEGGHLSQAVRLADRLSLYDEQTFALHGRTSDLVKIAGKRASLAALNSELNRVPGVLDGVFFVPDEKAMDGERLTAFAVAPGLTAEAIVAELRRRIDPVFLPRPLHLVAALPRNAIGKLPRGSLRRLGGELAGPKRKW
jgi:acyl-coenzyme A synthetase/AMP-(fatty) acid ligase